MLISPIDCDVEMSVLLRDTSDFKRKLSVWKTYYFLTV